MKYGASILVIVAAMTFSIVSGADQESDKGRLDDCYLDLTDIAKDMNEANMHQSEDAPKINRKFMDKKVRCNGLQKEFEKKYGSKYTIPKRKK